MPTIRDSTTGRFANQRPKEGDKECPICKKTFHYIRNRRNPAPKTCSKECRYKSTAKNEARQISRVCAVCKIVFSIPHSFLKRSLNDGTYCSKACRYKNKQKYTKKEKDDARNCLAKAIREKRMKKQICLACGDKDTQAHHYKGYAKENWLEIMWLCRKHHFAEHERLRRTGLNLLL